MNDKKFSFISCVNDNDVYNECLKYINSLNVPKGYEIETISIADAESMASGYNAGMKKSDAKYKIYLHQDIFIINKDFLYDILNIFRRDENIGMIGFIGTKIIPTNCIWWNSKHCYGKVYQNNDRIMGVLKFNDITSEYEEVGAIDGMIMTTQYDIPWRKDILTGWYFYDISQCVEFELKGYKIVIPNQDEPWIIHDCKQIKIPNEYAKDINIFYNEYLYSVVKILNNNVLLNKNLYDKEILSWRNIFIGALGDKYNICNSIDEYLIKKYNIKKENPNGLFYFDKFKALQYVLENKDKFDEFISKSEQCLYQKNYENAARWIFKGANFASTNHPGFYTSFKVESILLKCANKVPKVNVEIEYVHSNKRKILHVLSEGYPTGGHTRLVKNWIEKDKNSVHSLVTTWQSNTLPQWLKDEVIKSGGKIYSLDNFSNSFLLRASVLRKIAYEWADIVVLHMHMHDPIPVMAFGIEGGPPVIFLNHADHSFWIGSSIIDIIANIREAAQELSLKRRNIKDSVILPIPLKCKYNYINKRTAKQKLGLKEDTKVILSIASAWKYKSMNQYHIIDFLKDILRKNKNSIAIIIGPQNNGIWKKAYDETNGRIIALGVQNKIDIFYSAADVYIDSYIVSSLTSVLDAGLRGLPIISLKNYNNKTLSCDDLALNKINNNFYNPKTFINYVNKILSDNKFRKNESNKSFREVKKYHNDLWNKYLENLYSKVKNRKHKINLNNNSNDLIETYDLMLVLCYRKN